MKKAVEKKENRRVRYTRMALRESLLSQLGSMPLSKISVSRICEQADINRSTFYMYYKDVFDLMEQIENELYTELSSLTQTPHDLNRADELLKHIFEIIYKNRDLARVVFGKYGNKDFMVRVSSLFHKWILAKWRELFKDVDENTLSYILTFSTYTNIGVTEHWIVNGFQETPAQLAQLTNTLLYQGLSAYLPRNHQQLPGAKQPPINT